VHILQTIKYNEDPLDSDSADENEAIEGSNEAIKRRSKIQNLIEEF
jgi:hypothetical protein